MNLPKIKDFLNKLKIENYSEETIYNYERDLQVFASYLENKLDLFNINDITSNDIEEFKEYLSSTSRLTSQNKVIQKTLPYSSINRILSAVKSYLRYLHDNNIINVLKYDSVKLYKNFKKNTEMPSLGDVLKLIESPEKLEKEEVVRLRNRAMLEILFATGLSISELLSLKIDQINNRGIIHVFLNNKKQRIVYLTSRANECLSKYLATRNDDSPFLFIPYRGRNNQEKFKKISTNYLQYKIKKYRELIGIDSIISANSLRLSFFIYLHEHNINPPLVQILLCHESLDTTTRYVHASDKYAEKVHTKFHPLRL